MKKGRKKKKRDRSSRDSDIVFKVKKGACQVVFACMLCSYFVGFPFSTFCDQGGCIERLHSSFVNQASHSSRFYLLLSSFFLFCFFCFLYSTFFLPLLYPTRQSLLITLAIYPDDEDSSSLPV